MTGPLPLAADLFLIMLDDMGGTLRVRAAPVALAGGLLAELLDTGCVALSGGRLVLTGAAAPRDPLLVRALGWMMTEPTQTDPVYWLRYLAGTAVDEVASWLAGAGWIHLVERRRLRTRTVYQPVSANNVFWRAGRLYTGLADAAPGLDDLVLYGLIAAVDFAATAFRDMGGVSAERHHWINRRLAEHRPGHLVLINAVRVLAAQNTLTLRG